MQYYYSLVHVRKNSTKKIFALEVTCTNHKKDTEKNTQGILIRYIKKESE